MAAAESAHTRPPATGDWRPMLAALAEARAATLALVEHLGPEELERARSPIMSPLVWDLAHIAAYEDLWLSHRLAGQILAGPVRDVQPRGDWFQAGEFDNLGSLHRGNLLRMAQVIVSAVGKQTGQASLAIPLAGPPNGNFIAFQAGSDRALPFPSRT